MKLSTSSANELKKMLSERRTKPSSKAGLPGVAYPMMDGPGMSLPQRMNSNLRAYIIILDEVMSGASQDETTGEWTLGEGIGVAWYRDHGEESELAQDPDNPVESRVLLPYRNEDRECVRLRVFNPYVSSVPACYPIQVVQDLNGDLYVVEIPDGLGGNEDGNNVTSTTTSTTPPPCSGLCYWTWSAANQYWTLISNTCSVVTTTTSTSTSTSTSSTSPDPNTTTTEDPCSCGSTTTSTGDPNTSTTTTTEAPCSNCAYPSFCGLADGDCTYTACQKYPPNPGSLVCTSTTTSTTLVPTTTCDCNTTTTLPGCSLGCDWVGLPNYSTGVWSWYITANNCSSTCPCSMPTSDPYCNVGHTGCVQTPPTQTTPPPVCSGNCIWWWIPSLGAWQLTHNNCSYGWYNGHWCGCQAPSHSGSYCAPESTPCQTPTTSSTTTTAGPPCSGCYTSTTSSTSTTGDPCVSGSCKWRWSTASSVWMMISSTCPYSCPCVYPQTNGTGDCEVRFMPCNVPTTTSSTSTSTSSTTTSTSTTLPCGHACNLICSGGVWVPSGSTVCVSTCPCSGPGGEASGGSCVSPGQVIIGSCGITSTTCWPCSGQCVWECQAILNSAGGATWTLQTSNCNTNCNCPDPGINSDCYFFPCSYVGELHVANCWAGPCTSSNNCSTSTSTSSTTTTCGPCVTSTTSWPCGGNCLWQSQYNGTTWEWVKVQDNCNSGCSCLNPCDWDGFSACSMSGSYMATTCGDDGNPCLYCVSFTNHNCSDGSGTWCQTFPSSQCNYTVGQNVGIGNGGGYVCAGPFYGWTTPVPNQCGLCSTYNTTTTSTSTTTTTTTTTTSTTTTLTTAPPPPP